MSLLLTQFGRSEEMAPMRLPVVKTWSELSALPPLIDEPVPAFDARGKDAEPPKDGGDERIRIRVGIDRISARLNEGVLLYCLMETPRLPNEAVTDDDSLGPLKVRVEFPGAAPALSQMAINKTDVATRDGRYFFMKTIPLDQAGTYRIRVFPPSNLTEEKPLAEVRVEVSGERAPSWSPWSASSELGVNESAWEETEEGEPVALVQVSNPPGGAALPAIDGWVLQPLPEKIDPASPLPELLPEKPASGIRAQAQENRL
ncbi:MAG TPA: hypothetical protein VIS74_05270, partial [Chthoniobacterales bacterium]